MPTSSTCYFKIYIDFIMIDGSTRVMLIFHNANTFILREVLCIDLCVCVYICIKREGGSREGNIWILHKKFYHKKASFIKFLLLKTDFSLIFIILKTKLSQSR